MITGSRFLLREGTMRVTLALTCLLLLAPTGLTAEETTANVAAQLKALEERVRALEAELQALKAAQATTAPPSGEAAPAPPPAPTAAVTTVSAPTGAPGGPSGPLPVYGGQSALAKILNPDIGVIGNFTGAVGRNRINPLPSLSLQESEVSLQAIVDPYARADFFLAFGEEGVEV